MKTVKQITALMTALLMLFTAAQAERWMPAEKNAPRLQQLVVMLEEAVTSGGADTAAIDLLLEEIRREDADDYAIARAVTDHWYAVMLDPGYRMYQYRDEDRAVELEESGLDFGGKHAFVVLGYQLEDGEMKPELNGRCDAAAAAARTYPDSCVITTGGVTGGNNPLNHSEAGEMKKYLSAKCGIDDSRIFAEEKSKTTLQNAEFSFRILREQGVGKITVVTSDYHQRWGQVVFNAVAAIYAQVAGYRVEIVGNYNFRADPDNAAPESHVHITASQLGSVFRKGINIYRPGEQTE